MNFGSSVKGVGGGGRRVVHGRDPGDKPAAAQAAKAALETATAKTNPAAAPKFSRFSPSTPEHCWPTRTENFCTLSVSAGHADHRGRTQTAISGEATATARPTKSPGPASLPAGARRATVPAKARPRSRHNDASRQSASAAPKHGGMVRNVQAPSRRRSQPDWGPPNPKRARYSIEDAVGRELGYESNAEPAHKHQARRSGGGSPCRMDAVAF